jgi:hypothetical protein
MLIGPSRPKRVGAGRNVSASATMLPPPQHSKPWRRYRHVAERAFSDDRVD